MAQKELSPRYMREKIARQQRKIHDLEQTIILLNRRIFDLESLPSYTKNNYLAIIKERDELRLKLLEYDRILSRAAFDKIMRSTSLKT